MPHVKQYSTLSRGVKYAARGPKHGPPGVLIWLLLKEFKKIKKYTNTSCFVQLYFIKYEDLSNVLLCMKAKGKKTDFLFFVIYR